MLKIGDHVLINSITFSLDNVRGVIKSRSKYKSEPRAMVYFVQVKETSYSLSENELEVIKENK